MALNDAGIPSHEVDGIVTYPHGPRAEDIISSLNLPDVRFSASLQLGGASSVAALHLACAAITTGEASVVLAFVARNGRSEAPVHHRAVQVTAGSQYRIGLEIPFGMNVPAQWYALLCQRHMFEFGTSRRALGLVAVTMRRHAQLNPHAQMYGRPLTLEDYYASPFVADPYKLLDCCLETDGASAVVVTSAERARSCRWSPIMVAGVAQGRPDSPDDLCGRADFLATGLRKAAPRAFGMAGVTPRDVSAAMIYDCFTFEVIHQLEEAGFCGHGEGGPFVEQGSIELGSVLPTNPHGGLMSEGHVAGMNHIVEAVQQLRGVCGDRQVHNAEVIAVTGWGDLGDGALVVLTK
jgi:acetyl-CoA acetyltransferase